MTPDSALQHSSKEARNLFQRYEASSLFAFGGIACMAASLVTNPIDVMKVRLQLVGERIHHPIAPPMINHSSTGVVEYLNRARLLMVQEAGSGYGFLYQGVVPSLLREGSYSTIRMGLYEPFKNLLSDSESKNKPLPLWKKIIAGGAAGAVGAAIANPTDLVKVRMQVKSNEVKYRSTWDAFVRIYREGGIRALYCGVGPTTQRAVLLTASQLASYDQSKQILLSFGYRGDSVNTHFLSSIMAGFMCAVTTSPIDLVKSRIMLQNDKKKYRGVIDCMLKTVKYEGFFGLYRGFFLNWLRMGPHTIVTFLVFEELRSLVGIKPL
ncbi:mitochondrial carrier [Basidiobolus meristosporus CBS 931.73]|uniref:Mitochondrial carrier n=1 Tax=Basidiobolus meristosporus CBS 931.73 TaxID=1314790 RepID=A0A1Y1WRA4_9FUNG|nr:mitochondrial carrier [Basidiobolus meristosporus CBS 931.73]|eukprot:ORX76069.1 mitochondrial carrier [Basidiobolus meristosporus CBS 931.73]